MTRVLVVLVAFAAGFVSAEWNLDREDTIAEECQDKLNITGGFDGISELKDTGSDLKKFQCFLSCLGQGVGILTGEQDDYVPAKGNEYLEELFKNVELEPDDTSYNETLIRADLQNCFENASGIAKCEKAYNLYLCFKEHFDMTTSEEEYSASTSEEENSASAE